MFVAMDVEQPPTCELYTTVEAASIICTTLLRPTFFHNWIDFNKKLSVSKHFRTITSFVKVTGNIQTH